MTIEDSLSPSRTGSKRSRRLDLHAFGGLVERIEPKARWDDLRAPDALKSTLQEIVSTVRQSSLRGHDRRSTSPSARGRGTCVLFCGGTGTGKTLAAEVMALDLELDLYRIDLSAVVKKYIEETEKNLQRLFDAAGDGSAILFFDEADALFGKRSEVKDGHDRYANIEVGSLIRRMEAYEPLAILASSSKATFDDDLLRRLRVIVEFPLPEDSTRPRRWHAG